jgi:hypothetical protein
MPSCPKRVVLASSLAAALVVASRSFASGDPSGTGAPSPALVASVRAQIDAIGEASVRHWFERHPEPIPLRPAARRVVRSCADDGAPETLRGVMETAVSGDTIDLSELTCSTITLTAGKIQTPFASSDIAIVGPGMDELTISGGHLDHIIENIGYGNLRISDVSFADGYAFDGFGGCLIASRTGNGFELTRVRVSGCEARQFTQLYGGNLMGGGIFTIAELVLTDSVVTGNTLSSVLPDPGESADGLCGGGIGSFGGPFTLTRSTVTYNQIISETPISGIGWGGGLCLFYGHAATVSDSVVSHNTIHSNFVYPSILGGGGFRVWYDRNTVGSLVITNSTFADNAIEVATPIAATFGGGLESGMTTTIYGSTFSGNRADGLGVGGGLAPRRAAKIANTTISGNHAWLCGGLLATGTAEIDNSTIAFNTAETVIGGLVVGIDTTLRSSLISGNEATHNPDIGLYFSTGVLSGSHNFVGIPGVADRLSDTLSGDPLLAPLADNGGPTLTHALYAASPARNRGSNPLELEFDQRGAGFPRAFAAADIGAFEIKEPPLFANGFDP